MSFWSGEAKPQHTSETFPLVVDSLPESAFASLQRAEGLENPPFLGLCMAPGRQKEKSAHVWHRSLDDDLLRLRQHYGTDVLVSLITDPEMDSINQPDLLARVQDAGMESLHMPVHDKWIPSSIDAVLDLTFEIVERLRAGKRVVVHCNGGKGRSALLLVCCLIALDFAPGEAIDAVQAIREGTMRNPFQKVWAYYFARQWPEYVAERKSRSTASSS